jgi:hypothetical protein
MKIFTGYVDDLEEEINQWLQNCCIVIKDIKVSTLLDGSLAVLILYGVKEVFSNYEML